MKTQIYFTIQAEQEEIPDKIQGIDFMLEFDEAGECTDGESRNPFKTWGNYTTWHSGWIEEDEDLETLLASINEYSRTIELEEIVAQMEQCDINKEYKQLYTCEEYVEGEFIFTVTCYDIEVYDE